MSETKVLSKEEVDALLRVTHGQGEGNSLATEAGDASTWTESDIQSAINQKALQNIAELAASEGEKILTTFLRKKTLIKFKKSQYGTLAECIEGKVDNCVFTVFQALPGKQYGMAFVNLPFLHHVINLLFGGQFNVAEPVITAPGKIGLIVAEKLSELGLQAFAQGCNEYGEVTFEVVKTITAPNLTSKISLDDRVCLIEMAVTLGEAEVGLYMMFSDSFLTSFIPAHVSKDNKPMESNFWRTAIESQVADSQVEVSVTLSDVNIKVSDVMALKEGEIIPISDPTIVYVCLNNLKLFRATAGQANSKRVVRIVSEV